MLGQKVVLRQFRLTIWGIEIKQIPLIWAYPNVFPTGSVP